MLQSAVRSAPRRVLTSRFHLKTLSTRRFLSTAPLSQKSRTWKNSAARWALAIGGIYYYNTSTVFAEQPEEAISRLDQSLHQLQESKLPTLDSVVEEKRQRIAGQEAQAISAISVEQDSHDSLGNGEIEDMEDEADQQGAFNPETGEINWDCPCLGGMAHGPCGEEFKAAFSCFVYSKEEPKGMECIDKFKGMQDCFREHPEMYGSELEDDEDELEEELRAGAAPQSSNASEDIVTSSKGRPSASESTPLAAPGPAIERSQNATKAREAGDKGNELVPRVTHDDISK